MPKKDVDRLYKYNDGGRWRRFFKADTTGSPVPRGCADKSSAGADYGKYWFTRAGVDYLGASTRHTRGPGRRLGRPSPAVFNLMVFPSESRSAAIIASCDGWSNRRPARAPRQCTNTARPIKKKIYSRNASKEAGTTGKGGISTAQRSVKRGYGIAVMDLCWGPLCLAGA